MGESKKQDFETSDVNLCWKCESALRSGSFFVKKITVGPGKILRRCDYCQRMSWCAEFEVSKRKTIRPTE